MNALARRLLDGLRADVPGDVSVGELEQAVGRAFQRDVDARLAAEMQRLRARYADAVLSRLFPEAEARLAEFGLYDETIDDDQDAQAGLVAYAVAVTRVWRQWEVPEYTHAELQAEVAEALDAATMPLFALLRAE